MAETKPKHIQAVEMTRSLFESIHGNIGLLKFTIDKLEPNNGDNKDSDKWLIICSFYKTLGSVKPTTYKVDINLKAMTVSFEAISGEILPPAKGTYRFVEEKTTDKQ